MTLKFWSSMTEEIKTIGTSRHLRTSEPVYIFYALGTWDTERFKNVSKVTQVVSDKEWTRILLMAVLVEIGKKVLAGWGDNRQLDLRFGYVRFEVTVG